MAGDEEEGGARLLTSVSSAARLAAAADWLEKRGRAAEVVIVGASRRAADDLVRHIAGGFAASDGAFGWVRTGMSQLAVEVALPELSRRGRAPIGPVAAEALVARVVHELRDEGGLGVFARVDGGPGLARALTATIVELRHADIDRADLAAAAPDLARVLERYEEALSAAGFADRAAVFGVAAELIGRGDSSHAWLGLPTLLLDVRAANRAEQRLVAALLERASAVLATAPSGDPATERFLAPLFAALAELPPSEPSSLASLQRHLFGDATPEARPADDSVRVLSAPGEGRESVEIARQLLALAREGVPFDRMAVALRSPQEYVARLEEAFGRAGVAAYFSRGVVRPHPAGRAFVALLDCAAEGLSARRFAEYLSLSQVPDRQPAAADTAPAPPAHDLWPAALADSGPTPPELEDAAPVDDPEERVVIAGTVRAPRRWERLLSDAAVIGGLDRWRERLQSIEGALQAELQDRDESADDARREGLLSDLAALRDLRAFALPLLEPLARWPRQAVWAEWLALLGELAARALRRPATVRAALAELEPMAPIGPVTLDEVRAVLSQRLLSASIPPPASRYGRVYVAPIEMLRGLSFDVVFVPGLAERLFPRKIAEDPILLDRARRSLSSGYLTVNDDRLGEERLLLRLAAGAASRRLVLSYPRLDLEQARPRVPSFYALEALRAAEGTLPSFAALSARAERQTEARVGWPAPRDPRDAIDEAEHDLALLEQLRSRPAEEKVGTARFLLDANPHLGRALRFRARRWLRKWTPADGLVEPGKTARQVMAAHGLAARSYSPTALEKYAACPYQFFLYAVHRLAPREVADVVDDLDPLRRGSLVHDTQFALFERLRDAGLLPLTPANLAAARDLLDECLNDCAAQLRAQLLPRIERVWQDAIESIRADLREWLRRASEDDSGYVPWRFELAFGLTDRQGRDDRSVAEPVALDCGIRLRGSIDLVEQRTTGSTAPQLRATDHKTGKTRLSSRGLVGGGTSLQPVLYALALEKLYPEAEVEGGRLYYCTSNGSFAERDIALDRAARQAAGDVGRIVGEALEKPFLPAYPSRGACQWCDYRIVCGPYEETRTARKPAKDVARLLYLRELP